MTYSPGSPGYPPAQSPGSYGGSTPSFAKTVDSASRAQVYLTIVVVALGLGAYAASFLPMFTLSAEMGPGGGELLPSDLGAVVGVIAALLAGLLAAVGLLPKASNYTGIVAAIAVLGALLAIAQAVGGHSGLTIGVGLWLVLAFSVIQAIAAVGALLLEAGVITPPAPRPRYDQYGPYGPYGQYGQYGPPQSGAYFGQQHHAPAQHGPQYGYPPPSSGGFGPAGTQPGAHQAPQPGPQQGSPTPPTGFPSFSQPPSAGSGTESHESANSEHSGATTTSDQPSHGPGQRQSPSSSSGPTPS
ncbi:DUF5336 domain-containing protein [Mycobacterium sp. SM1]|uniref:DUF5336 domain-containing protein n=1 Tax=Mycobacterium sp. SM1 TaxID=2816243 RepID=UPI001BD13370|nr:DUF5336 domain-containing protein [Mycobacterium sp. SM1]MBS4729134.1 DUF5336 domain-containing protein [Mycobacterium sp. SM1]